MEGLALLGVVVLVGVGSAALAMRARTSRTARVAAVVVATVLALTATAGVAFVAAAAGCDAFAGRCEPGDLTSADTSAIAVVVGLIATVAVGVLGTWWIRRLPGPAEGGRRAPLT